MSKISWTEQTWNPIVGCSIVSPGCKNCYAMAMAARLQCMSDKNPHYNGTTHFVKGKSVWTGKLAQAPESILLKPLKRKKPTTYFVNSMGDLFHEDVPDEWIDKVFAVMALCPQHTFQILTKRSERMREYLSSINGTGNSNICKAINDIPYPLGNRHGSLLMPLPNVWLGVSAENQEQADKRVPDLLDTPAAIRFVSLEPQLEEINLKMLQHNPDNPDHFINSIDGYVVDSMQCEANKLDWVIQGCESGPGARPFDILWARSMRDQCAAAAVPYFLKQTINKSGELDRSQILDGVKHDAMPNIKDTS